MTTVTIQLPNDQHTRLKTLAARLRYQPEQTI